MSDAAKPIEYRIDADDVQAHVYAITLRVPQPAVGADNDVDTVVSLPVWIPGSYMVREFGRHLFGLRATQAGREVPLRQLDKTTWALRTSGRGALVLQYSAYAFDTSVRTAYLSTDRGFFNGTSLCLRVHGREAGPHTLRIGRLPRGWQVATSMPPLALTATGQGTYRAADYDELVDHPFELGRFWRGTFTACGVPHEMVVSGALPSFDGERLMADAQRICETQIRLWHGHGDTDRSRPRAPFDRYVFLLNTVEDGYGGLEHRASTALLAPRRDLPRKAQVGPAGQAVPNDGQVQLLGLISHEYFHAWNVKRLKPAELARIDYTRENHTQLLWFFEGFTSYYDDLVLRRCGLIDTPRYLQLLTRTVQGVQATPGQQVQSVAEASFDAWVKYYRQDENTVNATVSYYTKGSLIALCLDAALREAGTSLDAVMRALWCRDGPQRGARQGGGPVTEAEIFAAVDAAAGTPLSRELSRWVHGREGLPLQHAAARLGLTMRTERVPLAQALGLRLAEGALTGVQVKSVLRASAAERAGLQPGDEILAVDDWRIRRFDDAQAWADLDAGVELLLVRDQRLLRARLDTRDASRAQPGAQQWTLHEDTAADPAQRQVHRDWLGGAATPPKTATRAATRAPTPRRTR